MDKIRKDRKIAKILLIVTVVVFVLFCMVTSMTKTPEGQAENPAIGALSVVFLLSLIATIVFYVKSFMDRKYLTAEEKANILYEKESKRAEKEDRRKAEEEAKKLAMEKVEEERKKKEYNVEERAEFLANEQLKKDELEEIKRLEKERKQEAIAMSREEIKCPKCGSHQLSVDKKGYSLGKGAFGTILLGPIGLAAGGIGKNKVNITCLNCGYSWIAGRNKK